MYEEGGSHVDGFVETVTYLGNSLVYGIKLDWMDLEVREENRPGTDFHQPGTQITVSWDPEAISLVTD